MKLIKVLDWDAIHSFKEATVTSSKEHLKHDPILSKLADINFLKDSEIFLENMDAIPIVNLSRRLPVAQ